MREIQEALRSSGKMKLRLPMDKQEEAREWRDARAKADAEKPDLIVLGADNIALPYIPWKDGTLAYVTPFNKPGATVMWHAAVQGLAFGMGVSSLLLALDMIKLDKMPWQRMVHDGLISVDPKRMTKLGDLPS